MLTLRATLACTDRARVALAACLLVLAPVISIAAESNLLRPPAQDELIDFGHSVAADGDWVAVGAPAENEATGAVYLFDCPQLACASGVRVRSPDPEDKSSFGAAVALSGSRLAVGSPERDDGEVDIFRLQAGEWIHEERLVAFDGDNNDRFGAAVALVGDQLLVGAPRADNQAGSAYVFVRDQSGWTQVQRLDALDSSPGDRFGSSVALTATRAWVGAPLRDPDAEGPAYARGAVTAFVRTGGSWQASATLMPADSADGDLFGWSLGLAADHGVIGAPGAAARRGKAVVMLPMGPGWSESSTLEAPQSVAGTRFGWSVAATAESLIVGAAFAGATSEARCGAVFEFLPDGAMGWTAEPLRARGAQPFGLIGWAVAATADSVLATAPTLGPSGSVLRFEQQVTVFVDGYEGGAPGCE
jgi:hypothetical protein